MDIRLKEASLKTTRHREKILNEIMKSDESLSADEIYENLDKSVPLSSIYRNLSTLCSKGIIIKTYRDDISVYSKPSDHLHFIHCTKCMRDFPVAECPVDAMKSEIEKLTGFSITEHKLIISGLCPECKKK